MRKIFKKLGGLFLGLTLALGVGAAVSSKKASDAKATDALAFHLTGTDVCNDTSYAAYSGTVSSSSTSTVSEASWQITVGNNTASIGTNAKAANLSKTTLENGNFTAASGLATALGIQKSTTKYAAAICTTAIENVKSVELIYSGTNGGNITTAWVLSSTNGTAWEIEDQKSAPLTNSQFTFSTNSDSRQYAFVVYWNLTNAGGLKGFQLKLYQESPETQTISGNSEAFVGDLVTLSSNATSPTWSIVDAETTASGATITSNGVVSATGAGSVKVKAVASGYSDAYYTVTFSPAPGVMYSVSGNISNGYLSSTASVSENDPLNISVIGNAHFSAPSTITVTMGGSTLVSGQDYTYSAGTLSISSVTGNVVITANCVEDAKYSVTYVHGDHGVGSDYVVSDIYAGTSYELVSFETAGFAANGEYSFSKWSVNSQEKLPGESIEVNSDIKVTAIYTEQVIFTLVDDATKLADGTQFVLVGYASNTYCITKDLNSGHQKMQTITSGTSISNDLNIGSTLTTTEADVFTLVGSAGNWEIVRESNFLQFTGTSNGNDSFTESSGTSTMFTISSGSGSNNTIDIASNARSGRYWRYNTSTGDLRNGNSTYGNAVYMFAKIPAQDELLSVSTSGQKTTFTDGDAFAYNGTLTASYSISGDTTVTPTSFHLDSENGAEITTSTVLNRTDHNGHSIYVVYTDSKNVTKSCSYSITVNYAAVSSISLSDSTGSIGFESSFEVSDISVTVLPSNANQGYEWSYVSNTVDGDYLFDGKELLSGSTPGTVTLRCSSTADSSKYADFVLTISGNPVVHLVSDAVEGYVGHTVNVQYESSENMGTISSYTWTITSGSDKISIASGSSNATVTLNCVAAGSAEVKLTVSDGSKQGEVSATVTVSSDSVVSVSWEATDIDVYSGAQITSSIDDTWMSNYEKLSGDADYITYGEYSLYLGDEEISLPHTWSAADDGKTMHIEYGGVSSSSVNVSVCQTLQSITKPNLGEEHTSSLVFTAQCNGSGTADDGAKYSISSDGTESTYVENGIHYGTSSAFVTYIKASTSDIATGENEKITKIVVNACTAKDVTASVSVTVGGSAFGGSAQSLDTTAKEYTFEGNASGEIIVTVEKPSSAKKAIYLKSIVVTYAVQGAGEVEIANVAGHTAAQKAVVTYAKAFNTIMSGTNVCSGTKENLSSAWTEAGSAYSTFLSNISSLSPEEQQYAKDLLKYVSGGWEADTDSDLSYCVQRAMATYDYCVSVNGLTGFMSGVRTANSQRTSNVFSLDSINNSTWIIAVISLAGLTAIGGYFFYKKRKENN